MSINSFSSLNASSVYFICFVSTTGPHIYSAFAATSILLLLPLSTLVLYVGFQRWRRQRSTSMITAANHVDLFTYHMMAIEFVGLVGSGLYCSANYMGNLHVMLAAFYTFAIIHPGQTLIHCLTCLEHYLAVVHPITYRSLKETGGVRIRYISVACVWLMCFGWTGSIHMSFPNIAVYPYLSFFMFCLFVCSFCTLSVLRALTRPSPGEGGRGTERVDQSKQRAFHTVMAITGVLSLRFTGILVSMMTYVFVLRAGGDACVVLNSAYWFGLPSSLVLPLLFLHRAGKLACCRHNAESG